MEDVTRPVKTIGFLMGNAVNTPPVEVLRGMCQAACKIGAVLRTFNQMVFLPTHSDS